MLFLEVIRFFRITLPIGGRVTPLHALYKNVFSHRLLRLIHCALKKCIDFEQFGLKFVALPSIAKNAFRDWPFGLKREGKYSGKV